MGRCSELIRKFLINVIFRYLFQVWKKGQLSSLLLIGCWHPCQRWRKSRAKNWCVYFLLWPRDNAHVTFEREILAPPAPHFNFNPRFPSNFFLWFMAWRKSTKIRRFGDVCGANARRPEALENFSWATCVFLRCIRQAIEQVQAVVKPSFLFNLNFGFRQRWANQ